MSEARLREFITDHDLTPDLVILMAKIIKARDAVRKLERQQAKCIANGHHKPEDQETCLAS